MKGGRLVWVLVVPLLTLAWLAAGGRAVSLATGAEPFAVIYPWFPPAAAEDARILDRWFASQAPLVWIHIVAGSIVLLLAVLQFLPAIRRRVPAVHRSSGRLLLLAALPTGLSGLLLQARSPHGRMLADSAILLAGVLFFAALLLAYRAIRRGDPATHREWMLRMLAVGLGVGTVRLVAIPLILTTGLRPLELQGVAFWLGFALPILGGEWWIRATRAPDSTKLPAGAAAPAP